MLAKTNKFQSCVAYARSVALQSSRQQTRRSVSVQSSLPRHVLIVEFRDEIYASLSRVLEDEGLAVSRAEKASEVAAMSSGTSRDIVLINEAMPDESGWLISAKLRLSNTPRRLWMYTAKKLYCLQDWQELAGVEHAFCYEGDLLRLILALRAQINLQSKLEQKTAARNKVTTPARGAFSTNFSGLAPGLVG